MNETNESGSFPKKQAYRVRLELDFKTWVTEETWEFHRSLQITALEAEDHSPTFSNPILKLAIKSEREYFSGKCFDDIRIHCAQLVNEQIFNLAGQPSDREKLVKIRVNNFQKGLRSRLKGDRGRPEVGRNDDDATIARKARDFEMELRKIVADLRSHGKKITKSAVAAKKFPHNSNPLQTLNRGLKAHRVSFDSLLEILDTSPADDTKLPPI